MEQISVNAAQTEAQKQGRNLSEIVERLLEIWLEAVEDAADIADSEAAKAGDFSQNSRPSRGLECIASLLDQQPDANWRSWLKDSPLIPDHIG